MNRHTSRWAPALVAVLVLGACGTADDDDASVGAPPEPSVDTTVPSTDGDLRPPSPVEVVRGGAGQGVATSEAAGAADSEIATSDMRIAPWIAEYVVGDGMPALPVGDTGYVFDGSGEVTAEQVVAIASALGVSGEPVRIDEGYGVSWRVGPEDGTAPSVWVYDDGQQSWNFNAAWSDDVVALDCAVSIDSEGNETSTCPEPEPPVGVPGAAEAEQRSTDILVALGIDPATVSFETFADEWAASVNASDMTDARTAVRSWYFGFGAEGVLQWAGGSLAAPTPVGPYPLVDLDTAVARLSDGFFGGFGGGIAVAEPAIAVEGEVAPEPVEASDPPAEGSGTAEVPVPLPMPIDPPVDPEPVVVTLVDVQADLWWAWDADNVAWLLPAYRFIDTDGGWHVVPAVTDEFLIQTDPVLVDPIPGEPDGGIGDGAEPLPTPEPLPVDPETPVVDEPDTAPPDADPEATVAMFEPFVGLSIEEFTAEAEALGFETRIVTQDGESLAVTMDYRTDRVNVAVEGPRVVAVDSIG